MHLWFVVALTRGGQPEFGGRARWGKTFVSMANTFPLFGADANAISDQTEVFLRVFHLDPIFPEGATDGSPSASTNLQNHVRHTRYSEPIEMVRSMVMTN